MQASRVLVPVCGVAADEDALALACDMIRPVKGKVYVLYVIEVRRSLPLDADVEAENAKGEDVLQRMENLGQKFHVDLEAEILRARDAGPAVVQEAVDREVQAIVIGAPYGWHHGVFSLGHTAPYILRNAPCPVLLWRQEMSMNGKSKKGHEEGVSKGL
jgi:nucleotide-binding universal stress UspA family protein